MAKKKKKIINFQTDFYVKETVKMFLLAPRKSEYVKDLNRYL